MITLADCDKTILGDSYWHPAEGQKGLPHGYLLPDVNRPILEKPARRLFRIRAEYLLRFPNWISGVFPASSRLPIQCRCVAELFISADCLA